jgi:hypothetical protein
LKKSLQLQIFKNTPRPAEISADPQIWVVVTFGPRKCSETRGCIFYPVTCAHTLFGHKVPDLFVSHHVFAKIFTEFSSVFFTVEFSKDFCKNMVGNKKVWKLVPKYGMGI